ncbi:MAG: aldose 1-epimerase family protein [Synergistaceae bacterium]|jgi:hypothetical protein|nr:aldose 1-epimerase family protein [Synergistaceae bacterium]
MAKVFGKQMTRQEIYARVGNLTQIAGIKRYTLNSGRGKGVDAIDVNTGCFSFTLLPSRCLDISAVFYRGIQLGYMSKSGIRSPQYFNENGNKGFLDNFFGGLLTTSGLNNIGASSVDQGKEYGMHGELANTPAEEISCETEWDGDECNFFIRAKMMHSRFYGEDLLFERKVTACLGENRILLEDVVENLDFEPAAIMLLYHINFGYPLVDDVTEFIASPIVKTQPRTPKAELGIDVFNVFCPPIPLYEEECFYHWFETDVDGNAYTALYNPILNFSMYLKYDTKALPYFVQWKMMRSREYVFGFAPCNSWCEGRGDARDKGALQFLEPFEKKIFRLELGVVEGRFRP